MIWHVTRVQWQSQPMSRSVPLPPAMSGRSVLRSMYREKESDDWRVYFSPRTYVANHNHQPKSKRERERGRIRRKNSSSSLIFLWAWINTHSDEECRPLGPVKPFIPPFDTETLLMTPIVSAKCDTALMREEVRGSISDSPPDATERGSFSKWSKTFDDVVAFALRQWHITIDLPLFFS